MENIHIMLQKGNLFNPLTGYFDFDLIDSSEYDLRVCINGEIEYFRIRFHDFKYIVSKLNVNENYRFYKPIDAVSSTKEEIKEFRKSEFYNCEYDNKVLLDKYAPSSIHGKFVGNESYSRFLANRLQKNSIKAQLKYSFSVDSKMFYDRKGTMGYNVDVEVVNNKYYTLFLNCIGKKGYYKENHPSLFMIYHRDSFIKNKKEFEDDVISICIDENSPVNLTQSIFLFTGCDVDKTKDILRRLENYKDYLRGSNLEKFLKRELKERSIDSIKNSLIKAFGISTYQDIHFALENNNKVALEIIDYILEVKDDISSSLKIKTK